MLAIFKRELNAFFESPLGFIFLAVYYLFAGYFFFNYNLYGNTTDMRGVFDFMFTVTIFLIPLLTMRLLSEERKSKTEQLLLMSPVSSDGIVLGKFFSAVAVYFAAEAITLIMGGVLSFYSTLDWQTVIGHFIGLFLVGCTLISIGLFVSSITENQIIAAILGFCIGFFLVLLDSLGTIVNNSILASILTDMSFKIRYESFTLGMFNIADVIFFISITGLFLFYTKLSLEWRRLN